ncbi:AAA family ATPase [Jiangella asiatica]|uniref:AAA family ATPase n=1 Tax=Jiangella asiatica TaxID=2530372 RepID=A0A4V2Z244_9ACTN|nr:ATP-binding protein [Jiangella asiatica]TDE07398.1 AAA family ATPase [Jiangella asiatica]
MDDEIRRFATTFRTFLDQVVHQVALDGGDGEPLFAALEAHLGTDPRRLPVVVEPLTVFRYADADIALETLAQHHGGRRLAGLGGGEQRRHSSFGEIVERAATFGRYPLGAVDYIRLPTGPGSSRNVVSFGLHLLRYRDTPVAILQRAVQRQFGRERPELEVMAGDDTVVSALLAEVRRLMAEHSVLRGKVIALNPSEFGPSSEEVTYLPRPEVPADHVILPDGLLTRIERHLVGMDRHRDVLRAAGQHLKRGILLFGPPGTGKTHTINHLMSASPGTTVIVLTGRAFRLIQVAAETARALAPAVVVLEDCDLIAEDRSLSRGPQPLLFEMLDALDGLAADADVAFVLTTNRPDLLEPALAQRPGRVDLAVEIPLPDLEARRRLNRLYARDLPLSPAALDAAAEHAEGTTASFAKELIRRAVLVAAELGSTVSDQHLATVLDELLSDSEALTRSLLGNNQPGDGGPAGHTAAYPGAGSAGSTEVRRITRRDCD